MNYIKGRFMFDFITTIPIARLLKNLELSRLLYSVKILRMKKGLYLLDTGRIKDSVKDNFDSSLQYSIQNAKKQGILEEDSNFIDFIQINRQLKIIYCFQLFKLSMTIFGVSYFMGMIWYIICDLRRISSFVELNRPEEISFVTNYFDEKDKTNSQRAVEIMYYAFTSLSTVGFGDFHPLYSF